jgi:hypothetical protein
LRHDDVELGEDFVVIQLGRHGVGWASA